MDPLQLRTLTESERHRLLARKRRRLALSIIEELSTPTDVADIARGIAAETDLAWKGAMLTLHHVDLPMMDDYGIISYDPDTQRIEASTIAVS